MEMDNDTLTALLKKYDCSELEIKTLLTAFTNLLSCTGDITCSIKALLLQHWFKIYDCSEKLKPLLQILQMTFL